MWFPDQTQYVSNVKLVEKGATQDFIDAVFNFGEWVEDKVLFYKTCALSVNKLQISRMCLSNGLDLPAIPVEISKLNRIEERLVSARHVFQSIFTIGGLKGQYRSKGAIDNVPVSVTKTVEAIPRLLDDTNMISVKLTRRLIQNNNYMEGNVNPNYVWTAANVLSTSEAYIK